MLTLDDEIRNYLRRRLRNNIIKLELGGKSFWLKSGHSLFKRDPYDKRLIKVIVIQVFRTKNNEACGRCKDDKGAFLGCISIKSWMDGCCSNYKKFDACA